MTLVQGVDLAFWYILGVSIALLFVITVVMVFFVLKYRRSKKTVASDIRDNYPLEIIWIIIPTLIALSMSYVGWSSYFELRTVPDGAMEIQVIAQQYSWIFVYGNDKLRLK
jgi:heme/copper-type cytochrome/quinol oxidase subunit 2